MSKKFDRSSMNRRGFMAASASVVSTLVVPTAFAVQNLMISEKLEMLVGDRPLAEGTMIHIGIPKVAENGSTVPLKLAVDSPMTQSDYVESVHILAELNPFPEVASFYFTPASGRARVSIRMRLASSQNVIAVAQMSDGKAYFASEAIEVKIGGCRS